MASVCVAGAREALGIPERVIKEVEAKRRIWKEERREIMAVGVRRRGREKRNGEGESQSVDISFIYHTTLLYLCVSVNLAVRERRREGRR